MKRDRDEVYLRDFAQGLSSTNLAMRRSIIGFSSQSNVKVTFFYLDKSTLGPGGLPHTAQLAQGGLGGREAPELACAANRTARWNARRLRCGCLGGWCS